MPSPSARPEGAVEREAFDVRAAGARNDEGSDPQTREGFPPDLPPRLREVWDQARRYQALGQEHLWGAATRGWSPAKKMGFFADVVTRVAQALDAAPADHPWHHPHSDRLAVLAAALAARSYEEAFLDEMLGRLKGAADGDPTGVLRERLLGRRWQHWARFFADAQDAAKGERLWAGATVGKLLPPEAFPALLSACLSEGGTRGYRDAAVFVTTYCAGAFQRELASLDLSDWSRNPPSLRLGRGRGPFEDRTVPLGYEAANLLEGWVALRGRAPGPLFLPVDRYGAPAHDDDEGRVGPGAVRAALERRSKEARLPRVAHEDLRRTGLARLYEAGADSYAVADAAGTDSLRVARLHEPPPPAPRQTPKTSGTTAFHAW
jgi:integrase